LVFVISHVAMESSTGGSVAYEAFKRRRELIRGPALPTDREVWAQSIVDEFDAQVDQLESVLNKKLQRITKLQVQRGESPVRHRDRSAPWLAGGEAAESERRFESTCRKSLKEAVDAFYAILGPPLHDAERFVASDPKQDDGMVLAYHLDFAQQVHNRAHENVVGFVDYAKKEVRSMKEKYNELKQRTVAKRQALLQFENICRAEGIPVQSSPVSFLPTFHADLSSFQVDATADAAELAKQKEQLRSVNDNIFALETEITSLQQQIQAVPRRLRVRTPTQVLQEPEESSESEEPEPLETPRETIVLREEVADLQSELAMLAQEEEGLQGQVAALAG